MALVSGDMVSACGWYRVRRGCLSPCVVTSCCPRVYCYDPCASSYCGSWSVTYYNSDCCGESSYGVVTTGRDESLQMTPTLAEPHAAKRPATPETPAPKLEPTEAASPTDLPSVVEQPDAPPALDQPTTEPALPTDLDTPPAAAVPAAPMLPGTPATPGLPVTPATPATDLAPPAAVEQSSDPAPFEETTPDPGPATTPPAGAAPAATPAKEPEDLFGGAVEPPADAAPAEPPAGSSPAALPAATPPGETPEEKLDGLFDSPPDQAQPGDAPSDGATPATEEKGSSDSLENLFNDHRRDRRLPGRPATGGLASDEMRRWTDNTGRYSCRGRLQQISRTAVRILKENGRTSTVPLTRLSQIDLAFVRAEAIAAAERDGVRVAQY